MKSVWLPCMLSASCTSAQFQRCDPIPLATTAFVPRTATGNMSNGFYQCKGQGCMRSELILLHRHFTISSSFAWRSVACYHMRRLGSVRRWHFSPLFSKSTRVYLVIRIAIVPQATYQEQFSMISREFSRQSAFLFSYLSNISSPQASPHLGQLLLRLDFNNFFVGQPQAA